MSPEAVAALVLSLVVVVVCLMLYSTRRTAPTVARLLDDARPLSDAEREDLALRLVATLPLARIGGLWSRIGRMKNVANDGTLDGRVRDGN